MTIYFWLSIIVVIGTGLAVVVLRNWEKKLDAAIAKKEAEEKAWQEAKKNPVNVDSPPTGRHYSRVITDDFVDGRKLTEEELDARIRGVNEKRD